MEAMGTAAAATSFVLTVLAVTTAYGSEEPQGPVFLTSFPRDVTHVNTEDVRVPCVAFARPAPAVEWITDRGTPVQDVPGLLRILPNNTLHLLPFEADSFRPDVHNAVLHCRASNRDGTILSPTIHVQGVVAARYATYSVQTHDVYVMAGGAAVLRCAVRPAFVRRHVSVVAWTRDNQVVQPAGRYSLLNNGDLHVRDVTPLDAYATYRCVTNNTLTGTQRTGNPATIHVIDPVNSAPTLESSGAPISVSAGERVELPCVASGFPLVVYSWTRDNAPLATTERLARLGGNLVLDAVEVTDAGEYRCSARNQFGEKSVVIKLQVSAPLSARLTPAQQTIDVGESATFNCDVMAFPVETVTWLKDGVALTTNERVVVKTLSEPESLSVGPAGGGATHRVATHRVALVIVSVQREDAGMYQCVATNEDQQTQAAAQLDLGVAAPMFLEGFPDRYVRPGSDVSLACHVTGSPPPEVVWTLDDRDLPRDDPRFNVGHSVTDSGVVVSRVNVSSVRVEDGGVWTCRATNRAGAAVHTGTVHVYGPPHIRPMENVTVVAGTELRIRCHVTGFPIKEITWAKEGVSLPTNHRQVVQENGTLILEGVSRAQDQGWYTCSVSNFDDQGMSRDLYVHVAEPPVIDPFEFSSRKVGDRVSVSCVVSSGDLPLNISWFKDGKRVTRNIPGIRVQATGAYSSMLSIESASPRESGNYTCAASNRVASAQHSAAFHVLVPPRWVVNPQDSFVVLGSRLLLDCSSAGDPEPTITWKKARGPGPSDYEPIDFTNSSHVTQLGNGSLVLEHARSEDAGHFLCHAENGVGAGVSKVVQLIVHVPAHIGADAGSPNATAVLGSPASLDCVAHGDSPISISWSFQGRILDWQNDPRLSVDFFPVAGGRGSRLTLDPARPDDSGFYVCNTRNAFGSDVTTRHLLVLGPPDPPADVQVDVLGSRAIRVSWQRAPNGNTPIIEYTVQFINQSGEWSSADVNELTTGGSSLSLNVTDLRPATSYYVRALARNAVNQSEPSRVVVATTAQEAPSEPPSDVEVEAVDSQSLRVTWGPPDPLARNGEISGYYVGWRKYNSSAPYMYVTKSTAGEGFRPEVVLRPLERFARYSVHVTAFNAQGAGPASPDQSAFTLEDVPSAAPQGVQATALSPRSVLVMWFPPPLHTLHGILQGYKLLFRKVHQDTEEQLDITSKLTQVLYGLDPYSNYSVQVLAFTRVGDGVRSHPVFVRTQQDVPGRPADIKAVTAGPTQVLVAWRPPVHSNGVITRYTVHVADVSEQQASEWTVEVAGSSHSHLVSNLTLNRKYRFSVAASTVAGTGDATHHVTASASEKVPAAIASFSHKFHSPVHSDVILPCITVGDPPPTVTWKKGGQVVELSSRTRQLQNGSLRIWDLRETDAGNFTCRAENALGADEIIVTLVVQVAARAPRMHVVNTTTSSFTLQWEAPKKHDRIQGFSLLYRWAHGPWATARLPRGATAHTLGELRCGTEYIARLGVSDSTAEQGEGVTVKTNGSAPVMPPQNLLIHTLNSSHVTLNLGSWLDGGCPITSFDIKYKFWGQQAWTTVNSNINPDESSYVVSLRPSTWYVMRVTAQNEAGATDALLKFSTLDFAGNTMKPVRVVRRPAAAVAPDAPHRRPEVMLPVISGLVIVVVVMVTLLLYCRRRRDKLFYEAQNASNLRRDLTAETSLMSEASTVDKRLNTASRDRRPPGEMERPPGAEELRLPGAGEEQPCGSPPDLLSTRRTPLRQTSSSQDTEDAWCHVAVGDVNPYATFNSRAQNHYSLHPEHSLQEEPPVTDHYSRLDLIALEKVSTRQRFFEDRSSLFPETRFQSTSERRTGPTGLREPDCEQEALYQNPGDWFRGEDSSQPVYLLPSSQPMYSLPRTGRFVSFGAPSQVHESRTHRRFDQAVSPTVRQEHLAPLASPEGSPVHLVGPAGTRPVEESVPLVTKGRTHVGTEVHSPLQTHQC